MIKLHNNKLCIVGAGGFGREVLSSFKESFVLAGISIEDNVVFMDDNPALENKKVLGVSVIRFADFDPSEFDVSIAVGSPKSRKSIVGKLPKETQYVTLIHPSAIIMEETEIGEGSIITPGCIVTCNITIGKHSHLNLHTSIGHDCVLGDYFTTAPGARISGECNFGELVYFGTNACAKQGIEICDDVVIGMGGVAVKHIQESGVYIGNPLKKLER